MINNDVMRSIRYMLDLSDSKVVEITRLADPEFPLEKEEIPALLKRDGEEGAAVSYTHLDVYKRQAV